MGIPSLGQNGPSVHLGWMPILGREDGGQEIFQNGQTKDGSGFSSDPVIVLNRVMYCPTPN